MRTALFVALAAAFSIGVANTGDKGPAWLLLAGVAVLSMSAVEYARR